MQEGILKQQAAQTFLDAAAYIRRYGWQVSGMGRHGEPRCSMGALASANPAAVWDRDLAELMYHELYEKLGGIGLTEFNYLHNDGERVARLFERVALKFHRVPAVQLIQREHGIYA